MFQILSKYGYIQCKKRVEHELSHKPLQINQIILVGKLCENGIISET